VGNGGPGPVKAQHLTVEMVAAGPEIAQGGTQSVGIVFSMEEKWHILWTNPGFRGKPPSIRWTLPSNVSAGPLQFPNPQWLPLSNTVDYGYEDSEAFPVLVTAAPDAKADANGTIHLVATVAWTACKDICTTGTADLGIDLKLVPMGTQVNSDGATVGALRAAFASMPKPLPANFNITAISNGNDIALIAHTGTRETDAEFYPIDKGVLATGLQPFDILDDGAVIHMKRASTFKGKLTSVRGLLKFATEEGYMVTIPVTRGTIPGPVKDSVLHTMSLALGIIVAIALIGVLLVKTGRAKLVIKH
jgi:DsbC/DsbD-like thiol-disulfide interchange protein